MPCLQCRRAQRGEWRAGGWELKTHDLFFIPIMLGTVHTTQIKSNTESRRRMFSGVGKLRRKHFSKPSKVWWGWNSNFLRKAFFPFRKGVKGGREELEIIYGNAHFCYCRTANVMENFRINLNFPRTLISNSQALLRDTYCFIHFWCCFCLTVMNKFLSCA